jgi:glycosyltransferase involved in cell wall biosynthesis
MAEGNDILVSISCLVYNQVKFVRQTLDGFVSQKTNFRFEVLVNDDCSTDGTTDIIREYEKNYPDIIKPIYHKENQYSKGIPVSYSNNFNRVKGKYIALCEGDDYWIDPYKLQSQVDFLEANPDYSLTYTDYKTLFQVDGSFRDNNYERENFLHPTFRLHLIHTLYLAPCSWVFRTCDLPALSTRYVDTTYRIMLYFLALKKIKYIDKVTCVYRVLGESASHTPTLKKKYNFLRGLIKTQDECMVLYNAKPELVTEVHYHMYNRIFKLAVAIGDFQFIKLMKEFWSKNKCRNTSDRVYYFLSHFSHIMHPFFNCAYNIKTSVKQKLGIKD